jgi:hypothetical protein
MTQDRTINSQSPDNHDPDRTSPPTRPPAGRQDKQFDSVPPVLGPGDHHQGEGEARRAVYRNIATTSLPHPFFNIDRHDAASFPPSTIGGQG